ncbi:MAG: cupin domain-containing protein [Chloroflexi bacterium]|nr:cupin domain-containing protein [Chloroflexota bacterium]
MSATGEKAKLVHAPPDTRLYAAQTGEKMPIIDHNNVPEVPWRPGYRKWDVTLEEHGVSSSLSLNTAEPGTGAPLHTHAIDELIMIMEGTLEVRINGETHTVEKDHTVVIPPGAEHGFKVVGDKTASLIVFFPHMDPYSPVNTTYLEGSRPASVPGSVKD